MLTYADLFSDPILTSNETDLMGNSSDLESEKVHHHGLGVGDDLHWLEGRTRFFNLQNTFNMKQPTIYTNPWWCFIVKSSSDLAVNCSLGANGTCTVSAHLHSVRGRLVLQWVAAHCGLPGNEKVDELTKLGAKGGQQNNAVSFWEKGRLWERQLPLLRVVAAWDSALGKRLCNVMDYAWAWDCMHGYETTCTGHNQLMYMKMKLTPSPTYSCCLKRPSSGTGAKLLPTSADSETKCGASSSPATHTPNSTAATGDDNPVHLADFQIWV